VWSTSPRSWHGRIAAFLVLAYGIAWCLEGIGLLASAGRGTGELTAFGVFGPAVAGLLLSRKAERAPVERRRLKWALAAALWVGCWAVGYFSFAEPIRERFGLAAAALSGLVALIPAWILSAAFLSSDSGVRRFIQPLTSFRRWRWPLSAAALFALFLVGTVFLPEPLRGPVFRPRLPDAPNALVLFVALTFLRTFLYAGGVGEEPGWRGFLLPTLQERYSPLVASLVVWFFWALWHLPLDITGYVGNSFADYLDNRLLRLLPLSVIMTWLYNRSGGSVLTTAVFHTSMNAFPLFLPSAAGVVWILWIWAAAVVVLEQMWRRRPRSRELAEEWRARGP
jgi:membrane protease YdiL (CAAX protease family)